MKPIFAAAIPSLAAAALFVTLAARAQQPAAPQGQAAPAAEPYRPSLSDIMAQQQRRHIKLWYAGHAGNWPLASYEIGELSDGFDDVGDMLGGDTVQKMIGAQLAEVQKAIADKDESAFTQAFDGLTADCNNCHHLLDHGFIVIQQPVQLPYSDQSFAPQK